MTTDITINDGTTSRTYLSALGGPSRTKPNQVEHLRKVAEFDETPQSLLTRFTKDGSFNRSSLTFEKVAIDDTGRRSVMRTTITHHVEPGRFTQTESDNQLKELSVLLGTAGIATQVSQGNL